VTQGTGRDALYARLRYVLGNEEARTMIELLPPGGPGALATKQDIEGLERRIDGLEQRMERFDDRMHDFHAALREQARTFILASTTSTLTVGALAFAAARLV